MGCSSALHASGSCLSSVHLHQLTRQREIGQEGTTIRVQFPLLLGLDPAANTSGPVVVEITKTPGSTLGISLTTGFHRNKPAITIDRIRPASVVDR